MAKKESIVPGLGKKQIAVLNNEHARQLEHKRHLEELGFPEEVEPGFVRHAPVSYDDPSNPTPSKIVNQAGQDLGDPNREGSDHFKEFKYKPAKNIAKEAFLDFMQKQPANVEEVGGGGLKGAGATGGPSSIDSQDATSAGLPAGVSGPGNSVLANYQRSIDPSMTTNVAGTRDASDELFGIDPTGAGIGSANVGMTGTPGAGTADMENFKPATGTEDILNADFDTKMNQAQTGQLVKEAISEVFLNKDTTGSMGLPSLESLKNKKEKEELTPEEERRKYGDIGYGILSTFRAIGKIPGALKDAYKWEQENIYDTSKLVPASWQKNPPKTEKELKEFLEDKANTEIKQQQLANVMTGVGIDVEPYTPAGSYNPMDFGGPEVQPGVTQISPDAAEKRTETIAVDPSTPDASGVPQGFQPGGFVGGTFESGKGQSMDQSKIEEPKGEAFESTYKPPTTTQGQLQADPGKAFAEQFGNRPDFDMSNYGSTSEGRKLALDEGLVDGKQFGTITGPGTPTAPDGTNTGYRIEVKPKNYPTAKPGDVITLSKMDAYNAWIEKAEGEGAMAKVQLDRVSDLAAMMHDILEDGDELPGWIQNKISDSLHNLEASVSHIMYDEKEERGLVKSKDTFQDFLAKAPQDRGYLQGANDIFLQKWVGAIARIAPLVAPALLKLLPKLFTKTVPKMKRGKPLTKVKADGTVVQQTRTVLSPIKTAGTVGTAAYLYDTTANPDWNPFEGLEDDPDFKEASEQMNSLSPDQQKMIKDSTLEEISRQMDSQPQEVQDAGFDNFKNLSEGNTTVGEVLSASQAADVGASDRGPKYGYGAGEDWKATDPSIRSTDKDPKFKGVSFRMPVYDTSPEQTAKVRAGGPEKIIGYKVDGGETTKLKTPVSNMGDLNRMLVKEAFIELQKERKKDSRLKNAGVAGYNKPKRTPKHPKKSHVVVAKEGKKVKTIRFGEQGAKTAGDRKKGESAKMRKKRKSFKARHRKNIKRGKMSAAYWADKVKW